jgi:hypothetical protein
MSETSVSSSDIINTLTSNDGSEVQMTKTQPSLKDTDELIETTDSSSTELNATITSNSESNESSDAVATDISTIENNNEETSSDDGKGKSFQFKIFKSFEERIDELRDFKLKNGHCRVPSKFESNPSMAAWCANLKQSYRLMQEGRKPILKLTKEKIEVLEEVGFEWKYSGRLSRRNSFDVNTAIETSPQPSLLPDEKIKHTSLAVIEDKKDTYGTYGTESTVEEDKKIVSTPDAMKEESCTDDNPTAIASSIKKRMITRNSEMSSTTSSTKKTRRERSKSKTFDERLEDLKAFKIKHGNCHVSRNDSMYYSLGSWCHNMRISFRTTRKLDGQDVPVLSQDKIDALNEVGFDWTIKEARQIKSFDERLQDLRRFKETYGHTRVPTGYEKNPSLAYWCNNVRNAFKMKNSGKKQYISLNQERIDALEELGFEFGKRSRRSSSSELKNPTEQDGKNDTNNKKSCKIQDTPAGSDNTPETKARSDKTEKVVGLEGGVGPIIFI